MVRTSIFKFCTCFNYGYFKPFNIIIKRVYFNSEKNNKKCNRVLEIFQNLINWKLKYSKIIKA